MNLLQRFYDKVDKTDSCWNWKFGKISGGYGEFYFNGKQIMAHRFSYELHKGKIPEGKELDHLCRNHSCVNPDHLEAVTHKENILRGHTLPAKNSKKTQCPQGHEYGKQNTYYEPNGHRHCKICRLKTAKEFCYKDKGMEFKKANEI